MKLLIATRNPGKVREYAAIYADLPLYLTSLSSEGITSTVQETGTTYRENAVLKAEAYARESGLLTLADDSGLEVDALRGEPGVRSSRYAGEGASDEDRYRLLLDNLSGVSWEERAARFRCVVAIAMPGEGIHCTEGTCEGIMTFEPKGTHGFGYDPIFHLPEHGCTMGELAEEVKNRISHRAKAARAARPLLEQLLAQARGA